MSNLICFCEMGANGSFPEPYNQFLGSARLLPFLKKNLPVFVRSAVGEVLRRLVSKLLVDMFQSYLVDYLKPLQLGCGYRGRPNSFTDASNSTLNEPIIDGVQWSGWYMDHCTLNIIAPLSTQKEVLTILENDGPSFGLAVNASKSKASGAHLSPKLMDAHGLQSIPVDAVDPSAARVLGLPTDIPDLFDIHLKQLLDHISWHNICSLMSCTHAQSLGSQVTFYAEI